MLLLVHPPTGTWGRSVYYPSGLLALLASARQAGFEVDLLDLEHLTRSGRMELDSPSFFERALEKIVSYDADIVGFGTLATNLHLTIHLARLVRKASPKTRIILGGPQASALATEILESFNSTIDVIVIGEGERTLVSLLNSSFAPPNISDIPGVAFFHDSEVRINEPCHLIEDLDDLPLPDPKSERDAIERYLELARTEDVFPFSYSVEVGRGCPFRCSFCSTSAMWRRKDRRKSPARIFKEMELLAQDGLESFAFTHDNLTASKGFLHDFCNFLIERGNRYTWSASSKGDALTAEELALMKRAGCTAFFFGLESGSEHMQAVFQKNLDLRRCRETLELCGSLGMRSRSNFILGHPEETEEDADQTLSMALDIASMPKTLVNIAKICPLPGSLDCKRYRDEIFFADNLSEIACRPFRFPATETLISEQPNLFSAFSSFPCRYLEDSELVFLIEFYSAILERYPRLVREAVRREPVTPIDLFRLWMGWKSANFPQEAINNEWILETFSSFFRSEIIQKGKPS